MKKEKSILEEEEEFLEYIAKNAETKKILVENLKKKFGKEKYKRIYDLCGGKYTGGLPIREGKKRDLKLYLSDNGKKYLEEIRKERRRDFRAKIMMAANIILALATIGLLITTAIYAFSTRDLIEISSNQFKTENRPYLSISKFELKEGEDGVSLTTAVENMGKLPAKLFYTLISAPQKNQELVTEDLRMIASGESWIWPAIKIPKSDMYNKNIFNVKLKYSSIDNDEDTYCINYHFRYEGDPRKKISLVNSTVCE